MCDRATLVTPIFDSRRLVRLRTRSRPTGWLFTPSLLIVMASGSVGRAQVELWRANAGGAESNDISVDASGNVYITGARVVSGEQENFLTIKYNASGSEQWSALYSGANLGDDRSNAIGLDSFGSVYITGRTIGSGTGNDYTTLKYSNGGVQQWARSYNFSGTSSDIALALAVDSSGNTYVTGRSASANDDFATIKYDTNGNQTWVSRFNGAANGVDRGYAVTFDGSGNVFVTGQTRGASNDDYGLVKYNSGGVQQWVATYNGPGNSDDIARAIAVDGSNNIYIAGNSGGSGTVDDYATIKYNNNGTQLWVQRYNGPASSNDSAAALFLDAAANVFVTGNSIGTTATNDYATVKYSTTGTQQWTSRYNGAGNPEDIGVDVKVDGDGNVFVTGSSGSNFATVLYAPNGAQQDVAISNAGTARALAIDGQKHAYVTGGTISTIKYQFCTGNDCNSNGLRDSCDIDLGTSEDCNTNNVPDECDVVGGTSDDCASNGVPDTCDGATWNGTSGASFGNAGNWSPAIVPSSNALLTNSSNVDNLAILDSSGTTRLCSLSIGATGSGRQTLRIADGAVLEILDAAQVSSGGEIQLRGGELSGGPVTNASNTISGYGEISSDIDNAGLIAGQAGLNVSLLLSGGTLENEASGVVRAGIGSVVVVESPSVTQAGTLEARVNASLSLLTPLTNTDGAVISLLGGGIGADGLTNEVGATISGFGAIDSSVDNNGMMVIIADMQIVGHLNNEGTITIQNGILTVTGDFSGGGAVIGGFGG